MVTRHYQPPKSALERGLNRGVRWLAQRGVNLAGAEVLSVPGRTSGRLQRVPVNPLVVDGVEYLVSPRGHSQWVRNARAAGRVELTRGRRSRSVRLTEIVEAQRPPVLRAYLQRWGWEVGRFLPAGMGTDPDDETLAAHAADLPVFAIDR